jgi:asparagine synthase (glutamine-hydrolysing)
MCGIAGLVLPAGRRAEEAAVRELTDAIVHRGPDSGGAWAGDNVALGNRRLSIVDLSPAGDQPQGNEDGSVQLTFNGEVYNFRELTAELKARGHVFRSRSDTEAVVHGWEEWGEGIVPRLRGMFAFALFDRRAGRLLLARDRTGKKPLYWSAGAAGLVFASEIKALFRHPAVSRELDLAALGEYMVYGATAEPRTAYAAVRALPPGCYALVATAAARPAPVVHRYWRFEPRPEPDLDEASFLDELDGVLSEAVRLRMLADVPVGAFLSGGVDSSLIVGMMARHAPGRVATYTIGFEEEGWNEAPSARAVAEHLGTDHHEATVTADAVALLPELVGIYDEPFGDPSAIPTWHVSRMTRRDLKAALSGDGGDELFLGYRRHAECLALDRLGRLLGPAGRAAAGWAGRRLPTGSWAGRGLDRLSRRGFDLYHHALGWSVVYLSLLGPEVAAALGGPAGQRAAAAFARGEGLSFLGRCRATDLETWLPDQILVKADRASMANSLELRCPLLDQEVVELAARLPPERQIVRGQGKRLLRRLAARYVPAPLLDRPKRGFGIPLDRWFRGPLGALLDERLADAAHPAWRFFDRAAAGRRLAAHRARRADAGSALWRLLFFAVWAERSLD